MKFDKQMQNHIEKNVKNQPFTTPFKNESSKLADVKQHHKNILLRNTVTFWRRAAK